MKRKDITKLLTEILIANKLSDRKYYAKEVTIDYGKENQKRVDVMQFVPQGILSPSGIEKGIFICYEIKSCKQDIYSGSGLNFLGEKNYIVTTMQTYNDLKEDLTNGVLMQYVKEHYPESSKSFGIMVPVPACIDLRNTQDVYNEMIHPAEFNGSVSAWKMYTISPCHESNRQHSMVELLFNMLRSKHNYSNHI